jgi:hypothetical protein
VDDETRSFLQRAVARELDLPERLAGRIGGDDLGAMRRDGAQLAESLGITPAEPSGERERDPQGRFAGDMNAKIRAAAGR